jgi:hypothetical protein
MPAEQSSGWWRTLPGVVTAIAGLLTAVTGLVLGLHEIGVLWAPEPAPPSVAGDVEDGAGDGAGPTQPPASAASSSSSPTTSSGPLYETTVPLGRSMRSAETSYEILGSEVRPDSDGMIALSLLMRMTNHRDYSDNFWDASFRLVVGDDTYAPSSGLNELVAGGATGRGTVLFVFPDTTREAELLITVTGGGSLSVPFEVRPIA